jgi:hypothetical protein
MDERGDVKIQRKMISEIQIENLPGLAAALHGFGGTFEQVGAFY